jgi:hypothetical protein
MTLKTLYSLDTSFHFDQSPQYLINVATARRQNIIEAVEMLLEEEDSQLHTFDSESSGLPSIRLYGPHYDDQLIERATSIINSDLDQHAECSICLLNETDCKLPCGHHFHYDNCIHPWFFQHNKDSCPYCRQKF